MRKGLKTGGISVVKVRTDKFGKYIFLLYIFLVLSLPDGIKNMTCLYKMSTKGLPIVYTYNYYFSILEIPIIIVGLYVYRFSSIIRFGRVVLTVALINIVFAILEVEMNIVSIQSYEMFLLLITGFSTASIVLWIADDFREVEKILDCFILFQFLLQLVSMVTGTSGADGRYAAIGMGSGATASLAATYLVWTFFSRTEKVNWLVVMCSLVSIVLTGSRTNLLAFLLIAFVFSGRLIRRQIQQGNQTLMLLLLIIGIPLIVMVLCVGYQKGAFSALTRVLDLFQGSVVTNISNDDSYLGRLRSIEGSMRILGKNPFGIPFSIYAIESYSARTFSMEYPHSTLLSYVLLWSPIVAGYCVFYLIRLMARCIKRGLDDWIYILYYLMMIVLYGSPVLYSKSYAMTLILVSFVVQKIKASDNGAVFERHIMVDNPSVETE